MAEAYSIEEGHEEAVRARMELQSTLQNGDLLLGNACLDATPPPSPTAMHHKHIRPPPQYCAQRMTPYTLCVMMHCK